MSREPLTPTVTQITDTILDIVVNLDCLALPVYATQGLIERLKTLFEKEEWEHARDVVAKYIPDEIPYSDVQYVSHLDSMFSLLLNQKEE